MIIDDPEESYNRHFRSLSIIYFNTDKSMKKLKIKLRQ